MVRRKITLKHYFTFWDGSKVPVLEEVLEFLVPLELLLHAQWVRPVVRRNRLLPVGHRRRGDVFIQPSPLDLPTLVSYKAKGSGIMPGLNQLFTCPICDERSDGLAWNEATVEMYGTSSTRIHQIDVINIHDAFFVCPVCGEIEICAHSIPELVEEVLDKPAL